MVGDDLQDALCVPQQVEPPWILCMTNHDMFAAARPMLDAAVTCMCDQAPTPPLAGNATVVK
jgi:hypothetical protein